jgi:hypothetical protein
MGKYLKHRLGKKQKQYGIGKSSDPHVRFHSRYERLEKACKVDYDENVSAERRIYRLFSLVWRMATRRLSHDFEVYLLAHGITRTTEGVLIRMASPTPQKPAAAMPIITEDAMRNLLERIKQNDKAASDELRQLAKTDPDKWLNNLDLASIAKNEILHCIATNDPVSKLLLEERMQLKLDLLSKAASSPMEEMLIEHIQLSVIAAEYNRLMLIDDRRSMRERDSFEKRAEKAESQLMGILRMFHELKMLASSNWSKLPTELPVLEPVFPCKQKAKRASSVADMESQLDYNLCSMVI